MATSKRVQHYFARHQEVSLEQFMLDAVRREIDFHERAGAGNGLWHRGGEGQTTRPSSAWRPRPTEEDIRLHAWLNERLAILHRQRHGLWATLRRFLFGTA
jgi:hypothetical protein